MTCSPPTFRCVLIAAVTLSTVLVTGLLSWFFTVQYKHEAMVHLHHYAVTVAENVVSAEAGFIITEDYASLQDSLVSFHQRVHVESITVTTPDGTIIADTHAERIGDSLDITRGGSRQPDDKTTQVYFKSDRAETLLPILVGGAIIGWCETIFNIQYIQHTIASFQKKIIIVAVAAVLALSTVLSFFSALLTRPLEEIMTAAAKVAGGDFDQQAGVAGVYEIRRLADAFNIMTLAIRERETRLRQAQKMEAIGVLSSSIAHEFGNPLIGISFLLNDLKENADIGGEHRHMLDLGIEECLRMKKLIRDLKYFYQPSSGQKRLVNLHQILDDILLFQHAYLKSLNIEVIKEYAGVVPQVMVVEDQIKQVLVNLFINAAESMRKGGGSVTISTAIDKKSVSVTIRDTGVGINLKDQDKIFMSFFSTKSEVTGTGLGLSVSYGIVKNHQGDIRVSSVPGQGTTFILTLPIKELAENDLQLTDVVARNGFIKN